MSGLLSRLLVAALLIPLGAAAQSSTSTSGKIGASTNITGGTGPSTGGMNSALLAEHDKSWAATQSYRAVGVEQHFKEMQFRTKRLADLNALIQEVDRLVGASGNAHETTPIESSAKQGLATKLGALGITPPPATVGDLKILAAFLKKQRDEAVEAQKKDLADLEHLLDQRGEHFKAVANYVTKAGEARGSMQGKTP